VYTGTWWEVLLGVRVSIDGRLILWGGEGGKDNDRVECNFNSTEGVWYGVSVNSIELLFRKEILLVRTKAFPSS